jgi:hypothetical protein
MFWLSVSIESDKRLFDLVMQEREMWGEYRDPRGGCSPGFTHFIRSFLGSIIARFIILKNLPLKVLLYILRALILRMAFNFGLIYNLFNSIIAIQIYSLSLYHII